MKSFPGKNADNSESEYWVRIENGKYHCDCPPLVIQASLAFISPIRGWTGNQYQTNGALICAAQHSATSCCYIYTTQQLTSLKVTALCPIGADVTDSGNIACLHRCISVGSRSVSLGMWKTTILEAAVIEDRNFINR